ncbi:hypothetical protein [Candidatus Nitrospira bockiana]
MPEQPSYLADFDSALGMLRALSRCLRGRDFPLLGTLPRWAGPPMRWLGAVINRLPRAAREQVYIWSGRFEAISGRRLQEIDGDAIADWIVSCYPPRSYPAVAIGSANGAATHLWAALGVPWLPQTVLVPVARSGIAPDEPEREMAWGRAPGRLVLQRNPDLQLHHMHDPVQDRLMVQRMSYFRFKRRTLGQAYRRFLEQSLEPGGTVLLVECGLSWPVTECGERHVFQFGALGGATVEELQHGGPRVADYLRRYGSPLDRWSPPPVDRWAPEAEWGFEPSLREEVLALAEQNGWRVRRVVFEQPEAMSPLVADLYEWWNRRRGIEARRLLVESFILMEPYWTMRTGSIPFWMVFNKEPSLEALERYLDRKTVEEISLTLFSHGVDSIGLVPIERWRRVLARARVGRFVGVDEHAFPRDFAVYSRYSYDLLKTVSARYPMPVPLTLKDLDVFLDQHPSPAVEWRAA